MEKATVISEERVEEDKQKAELYRELNNRVKELEVRELEFESDLAKKDKRLGQYANRNHELSLKIDELTMASERLGQEKKVLAMEFDLTRKKYNEIEEQLETASENLQKMHVQNADLEGVNSDLQAKLAMEKVLKESTIAKLATISEEYLAKKSKEHQKSKGMVRGFFHRNRNNNDNSVIGSSPSGSMINRDNDLEMKRKNGEIRNLREELRLAKEKMSNNSYQHDKDMKYYNDKNDELMTENKKLKDELLLLRPTAAPRESLRFAANFSIDSEKIKQARATLFAEYQANEADQNNLSSAITNQRNSSGGSFIPSLSADSGVSSPNTLAQNTYNNNNSSNNGTRTTNFRKTVNRKKEVLKFTPVYGELDAQDKTLRVWANDQRLEMPIFFQMKYVKHVKLVTQAELRRYRNNANWDTSIGKMFQIFYDNHMQIPAAFFMMANTENEAQVWIEKIKAYVEYANRAEKNGLGFGDFLIGVE